ncbi:MAG: hypothetical protein WBL63_23440 [Candidatus Acidiferrum sp.]
MFECGHLGAGARVEPVAPGIAEQIKCQDGQQNGKNGNTTMCGALNRWLRASLRMVPQLGIGARTPSPRKLVCLARLAGSGFALRLKTSLGSGWRR